MRRGERLDATRLAGLLLAAAGLVVLTAPGLSAPDPVGSLLMAGADTAGNVLRAGQHENLIGIARQADCAQSVGNALAQRRLALARTVLQEACGEGFMIGPGQRSIILT